MNQRNSFLSSLRTAYNRQGQAGRILIPGLAVLIFCCLCLGMLGVFRAAQRATPATGIPSPVILTVEGTQPTPTSLFDFDFPTLTPFPTQPFPTALPTLTSPPTFTPPPTPTAPPTGTSPPPSPTAPPPTPTRAGSVTIIGVNKVEEYAEIQNLTADPVDLDGWRLVSEIGSQSCRLRGTLQPNEVLRIWARRGDPGLDCRFQNNIWRDNAPDPAVLYNAQGQEVSRFP